jgi:predicted metal-dependent hydrolase
LSSRPSESSRAIPSTAINTMKAASTRWLSVGGIEVEIIRKDIKNLYLSVRPPDGLVRVSVPLCTTDDDAVRLVLVSRLDWIRKKQRVFQESTRQTQR